MFTPIGSLLKTLPRRSKIPEAIIALHVRKAFGESLKKVCSDLPAETLSKVEPAVFKNGVVTVVAPQIVCVELSMRSGELIKMINETLGRKIVSRIKFKNY